MSGATPLVESPALVVRGLRRTYGSTVAVDGLDLTVETGSFFGIVGPNGAGKTTTLSMAVGLVRPEAGSCEVHGVDVWRDPRAAKAMLGVLPAGLELPPRLTGPELLTYVGLLRGMAARLVESRREELLGVLDLTDAAQTLVTDYSTGMRKKLGLAVALLHGPRVLVLDEPFEAVDPVSATVVRSILAGFVRRGGTVVFSTHVMALVDLLCDHVAVLADGRLLASGPVSEVAHGRSMDEAFVDLVGGAPVTEGLSWLGS